MAPTPQRLKLAPVAVICGDRWHPASVIMDGLQAIDRADIAWEFIQEPADWSGEGLDRYSAIVLCKSNSKSPADPAPYLTESIQQEFQNYVERGGRLLVVHAGTVGYNQEPRLRELIGGGFRHHPSPCPVELMLAGDSPAGGPAPAGYIVYDEHYFMELFRDDLDIFLTSHSEHGTQPAGWTRRERAGRVCVLTPGHFAGVWQHPDFQRAIGSALDWCLAEGKSE